MGESEVPEEANDKLIEAFGFLEAFLGENEWMVGENLTLADLSVCTTLVSVELFIPVDEERFPHLTAWLQRVKELPYFEECNQAGLDEFKSKMPFPV